MNCLSTAVRDFVFVAGLILCVIGVACLIVSIIRARAARLGDRALQVLGGPAPHTLATAYEELHRIEQENQRLDKKMAGGFRDLTGEVTP
ncbi:MAG TPA: hypothetical protein VFB62_01845 [Polyangiaceae bacterium]|nr:hypothetical protein [Polyangiaceae bacterium]